MDNRNRHAATPATPDAPDAPDAMKTVVSTEGGNLTNPGALIDSTLPVPTPSDRDLRVHIQAISVNPIDTKQRALGTDLPDGHVLGWDAVGVVDAVGPTAKLFTPGDRVWYSGSVARPGTYAEFGLVDERIAAHAPTTLDDADAAALPLTAITAWESLFDKLRLTEQSTGTLLVLGGAGGVGSVLIQLAKQLTGLTVIATASREESRDWATTMGADHVVDHSADDFADHVAALAPQGVDYAFSTNSAGLVDFFVRVMRPFGQIVAIDNPVDLDLLPLKRKSLTWHWEFMFAKAVHGWNMEDQGRILQQVAELADSGRIRSTRTHTVDGVNARNLRDAHAQIESGHTVGKIVLTH